MLRRARLLLFAVALGAGLLAVPGVLPDPDPAARPAAADGPGPAGDTALDGAAGSGAAGECAPEDDAAREDGPFADDTPRADAAGVDAAGAGAAGADVAGADVAGAEVAGADATGAGAAGGGVAGGGAAGECVGGGAGDGAAGDGVSVGESGAAGAGLAAGPPVPPADAAAGVVEAVVPQVGSGATVVVPGAVPAPGAGAVRTVRVEVEGGLPVDGALFAGFVMATLNDPRSWGRDGAMSFARTDGDAEIVVVLASPDTSAALCRPLVTGGTLSCRTGPRAVITHYRWVLAHPDYGDDRTGYRQYVVNHEVGHVLGRGHEPCPGPGVLAPVMQQQTKGVGPCAPNPWPYP